MKKIVCFFLCICSILLANALIFTSCTPKNTTSNDTTTEDTSLEDSTPEQTTPEQTTPAECVHEWIAATCAAPKTCSKCGKTEGDISFEHTFEKEYECSVCKKSLITPIEEAIEIGMTYEKNSLFTFMLDIIAFRSVSLHILRQQ